MRTGVMIGVAAAAAIAFYAYRNKNSTGTIVTSGSGTSGSSGSANSNYHLYGGVYGGSPLLTGQSLMFTLTTYQGSSTQQGVANQNVSVTVTGPAGTLSQNVVMDTNGSGYIQYPASGLITQPGTVTIKASWKAPDGTTQSITKQATFVTQAQWNQLGL